MLLVDFIFEPYSDPNMPKFRIRTWDTGQWDMFTTGKYRLAYCLVEIKGNSEEIVCCGDDFFVASGKCIDDLETIATIGDFLTIQPGEVEEEFFAYHTDRQMSFLEDHGEALKCSVGEWASTKGIQFMG